MKSAFSIFFSLCWAYSKSEGGGGAVTACSAGLGRLYGYFPDTQILEVKPISIFTKMLIGLTQQRERVTLGPLSEGAVSDS